jgi:hypothetical protein
MMCRRLLEHPAGAGGAFAQSRSMGRSAFSSRSPPGRVLG